MQLREIMRERVVTIGPTELATSAWTRMRRRGIRHLVVTDDGEVVGVLSERDLGGRSGGDLREGRRVQDLMTPRVVSVEPETTLRRAADLMRTNLIGSLPVVDDGELTGIVTATDVFDALGDEARGALSQPEREMLRAPASSKALGGRPVPRSRARTPADGTRPPLRPSRSEKREAFTDRVPRPVKRSAGRTSAPLVPANIRVAGVTLDDDDRTYIRRRLGMKLGKFADNIERVTVRVEDVNGPRGGVDTSCRIKVVLSGLPSVTVETRGDSLEDTVNRALAGAERAVRRNVQRRRTKPLKTVPRKRATRSA
jgi:CBS domain-containing protein